MSTSECSTNQIETTMCFKNKMEERLIEAVRAFPCLWQVSSKGYKDLRAKENAWKEVASRVSS